MKKSKNTKESKEVFFTKINLNTANLTDIMTLYAMEEDLAIEILEYQKDNIITDPSDLLDLEAIDAQLISSWNDDFEDMRFNLNDASKKTLTKIKGIGSKLAAIILNEKEKLGKFTSLDDLKHIAGIGKNKFSELKSRFKIEDK